MNLRKYNVEGNRCFTQRHNTECEKHLRKRTEKKLVYRYNTTGVCSRSITIELDKRIIKNVIFEGGCSGNTQGVAALVQGMDADKVVPLLKDIKCGFKDTSCPGQLAIALTQALAQKDDISDKPERIDRAQDSPRKECNS